MLSADSTGQNRWVEAGLQAATGAVHHTTGPDCTSTLHVWTIRGEYLAFINPQEGLEMAFHSTDNIQDVKLISLGSVLFSW